MVVVAYSILVSAQGPRFLGFGAKGSRPGLDNLPTKQFQSRDQLEEIKETEKVGHRLGKKLANLNSHMNL